MATRLMVKNLPDQFKETKFKELFASRGGEITDLRLCFTKDGKFRKFGFIGYKTSDQAKDALKYFDKTFIGTSKIKVEFCKDLKDESDPRPWSKYSKGSSAFTKTSKEIEERKDKIRKLQTKEIKVDKTSKDKKFVNKDLDEVTNDPDFEEFLSLHLNKAKKQAWTNDVKVASDKAVVDDNENQSNSISGEAEFEDSSDDDDDNSFPNDKEEKVNSNDTVEMEPNKSQSSKSALDWLKSKVIKTQGQTTDSTEVTEEKDTSIRHNTSDSSDNSDNEIDSNIQKIVNSKTLKLRGVPFKCKEEDIIQFFKPLFIEDIRFTKNKKNRPTGYAFVDFSSFDDAKNALKNDKRKMEGRYIELFAVEDNKEIKVENKEPAKDVNRADISETGRLFIRNLTYSCTEEDIENLFKSYGELTEINLPVDKNSKKTTGYAFVTYMFPEHAVKALNALDGKVFQGRILTVLPGETKKSKENTISAEGSSFKKKKEAQMKNLSSSSHNWNALFLGQNAVADVMASRLNTTKHGLLNTEDKGGSVAVRMALGETELVSETRDFLTSHGVKLDVFGQANAVRSKNIILVKNLPSGTLVSELKEIFAKYGSLGRVLMPPFGITAIIEFDTNKEARDAFMNLAYSKFKHVPLYLEWAPSEALSGEVTTKIDEENKNENSDEEHESETENEPGATLFVKNLSFDTSEEKLREVFKSCGSLQNVTIARKQDPKKPGNLLSMGYGFVEYKKRQSADKAIKMLQNSELDGHKLELKKSHRETTAPKASRKASTLKEQTSSKLIVRNVPFEATEKEVRDLFSSFGHIKSLRLPKKMSGVGSHRGFAFVDFTTKQDAKRAFKALCQSTHLYGRRLVLEWAEEDETVETLRKKTAEHFHDDSEPLKKKKKSNIIESLDKISSTPSQIE